MDVHPVKRNTFPAPIPQIISEQQLPHGQRILAVLPHSDDGCYFGATLFHLNQHNELHIAINSPGYRGVAGNTTPEQKAAARLSEAHDWAKELGMKPEQLVNLAAEKTYATGSIDRVEQLRMFDLIDRLRPTMVFVPPISDTAQAINAHTRKMAINAVRHYLESAYWQDGLLEPVYLIEYITNHVPALAPSDRNLLVLFTDPSVANVKHRANRKHVTQYDRCCAELASIVEALNALLDADDIGRARKAGSPVPDLLPMQMDLHRGRGEHFGVTTIQVQMDGGGIPALIESRASLPTAPAQA